MTRPMTIAEKILAAHAGLGEVVSGQLVECDLDLVHANDITAPIAIDVCRQVSDGVFNPARIALVPDHYVPNKDIKSAEQAKLMREFAREHGIGHYYEVGCAGIEHALLPEQGVVVPGDLTIGADSHTCTYGALGAFSTGMGSTDVGVAFATGRAWFKVPESVKIVLEGELAPGVSAKDLILHVIGQIGVDGALYQVLEFVGPAVAHISMDGRFTMCNMAIEAGAKTGIFAVDDVTRAYVEQRAERSWVEYVSDEDASYTRVVRIDVSQVAPTVSLPHLPSNTKPAAGCNDMRIDQAVIGSCTTCAWPPRYCVTVWLLPACVASSSPQRKTCIASASTRVSWMCSSTRIAPCRHLPAGHVWAGIWACSRRASVASPRPTATSSAAWGPRTARSSSRVLPLPPQVPLPAMSARQSNYPRSFLERFSRTMIRTRSAKIAKQLRNSRTRAARSDSPRKTALRFQRFCSSGFAKRSGKLPCCGLIGMKSCN